MQSGLWDSSLACCRVTDTREPLVRRRFYFVWCAVSNFVDMAQDMPRNLDSHEVAYPQVKEAEADEN